MAVVITAEEVLQRIRDERAGHRCTGIDPLSWRVGTGPARYGCLGCGQRLETTPHGYRHISAEAFR